MWVWPAALGDVLALTKVRGAFDLYAPESPAEADKDVVALAVAPGFGDAEVECRRAGDEFGLGGLAAALVVVIGDTYGVEGDWPCGWVVRDEDALAGCDQIYCSVPCSRFLSHKKRRSWWLRLTTP